MSNDCKKEEDYNNYILLGYIGAVILAIGPTYQSIKIWRTKRSLDISILWCVNYIIGLIFVITYLSYEKAIPVLAGNSFELFNVIVMVCSKIYLEKKFFCLEWDIQPPDIIKMNINDFVKVATRNVITFSMDYEEIYKLLEKSNDEEDIFLLSITRDELRLMEQKMDNAPILDDEDTLVEEKHREIHDSDEELSDNDEIVYLNLTP